MLWATGTGSSWRAAATSATTLGIALDANNADGRFETSVDKPWREVLRGCFAPP